jgi:hypothetical protein
MFRKNLEKIEILSKRGYDRRRFYSFSVNKEHAEDMQKLAFYVLLRLRCNTSISLQNNLELLKNLDVLSEYLAYAVRPFSKNMKN